MTKPHARPWMAWLAGAAVVALTSPRVDAQVATNIQPDEALSAFNLGTSVTTAGAIHTIDGGTLKGSNLFHSFSGFSLAMGDTALWKYSGEQPAGIANVINRVTGPSQSYISGALKLDPDTLPHAAFYFINPAGIVFGAGASVDVPGAAYFSTAQELRFSSGPVFSAVTATGSRLSIATPTAFGFLGGQGDINFGDVGAVGDDGSVIPALFHSTLFLSAANLLFTNAVFNTGKLDLIAVGDQAAQVRIFDPLSGFDPRVGGDITLDAVITIAPGMSAGADGSLRVGGKMVTTSDVTDLEIQAGDRHQGGDVTIVAQTLQTNGKLQTTAAGSPETYQKDAGNIDITAETVAVGSFSFLGSHQEGMGKSGNITIKTHSLYDSGRISSAGQEDDPHSVQSGLVKIHADIIDVQGGIIETRGDLPGNVDITTDSMIVEGGGSVDTDGLGSGTGGNVIVVAAGPIDVLTLGRISSSTRGDFPGGNINITTAGRLLIDGGAIEASSSETGNGGTITIKAGPVTLANDGSIATNSTAGAAGDIDLIFPNGGLLTLEGTTAIGKITTTSGETTAGRISIIGPLSVILNGGQIQALGPRQGAFVTITAGSIVESSDRLNSIDVAGALILNSQIFDAGEAVTLNDLTFDDASKVLRGQCPALRARGETSQLGTSLNGPYGPSPASDADTESAASPGRIVGRCGAMPTPP